MEENEVLDNLEEQEEELRPEPMGVRIQALKDINGDRVYPDTTAKAVYMPGKMTTIYDELNSFNELAYVTSFEDGNITKTFPNGDKVVTTFGDGNIKETYYINNGDDTFVVRYTKTTTFNEDGTISTDVQYGEGA